MAKPVPFVAWIAIFAGSGSAWRFSTLMFWRTCLPSLIMMPRLPILIPIELNFTIGACAVPSSSTEDCMPIRIHSLQMFLAYSLHHSNQISPAKDS